MSSQKVVILTTGGTIAMKSGPDGSLVPAVSGRDLVDAVPGLSHYANIEVLEFSNIPSCQMTPQKMFALAGRTRDILEEPDVAGIVITHGTDTLEETAYFLDMILDSEKPVVVTGAMRGAADLSADGPRNILCAVKAASARETRGMGALVLLNEQLHAAGQVTKTHTANPAAFASPWQGPVGYVDEDRIIITRKPARGKKLSPAKLGGEVYLLKMCAGSDDLLINVLIERKAAGIVIEGFGRGHVPPAVQKAMIRAVKNDMPVVLVSRCGAGRPYWSYGYEGGGKISHENGIIFAGDLTGPKARLRLMLALGLETDLRELNKYFDNSAYTQEQHTA